jgi:hypothetical protein
MEKHSKSAQVTDFEQFLIGLDKRPEKQTKPKRNTTDRPLTQKPTRTVINLNEIQTDFEKFLCEMDNSKLSKTNKNKTKPVVETTDQVLMEFDELIQAIDGKPGNVRNKSTSMPKCTTTAALFNAEGIERERIVNDKDAEDSRVTLFSLVLSQRITIKFPI